MQRSAYTCRRCLELLPKASRQAPCFQSRLISSSRSLPSSSTTTTTTTASNSPITKKAAAKSYILGTQSSSRRGISFVGSQERVSQSIEAAPAATGGQPGAIPTDEASDAERIHVLQDNLFHPFSSSPSPSMRRRAAFMKQHAYCPHPSHQRTRQPTAPFDLEHRKPLPTDSASASPPAHVRFECPDCGVPVACCKEHWEDDYEAHLEICDTLREINEDDHDLRSGRNFAEFEYPGPQRAEEFVVNMSDWDTFLYTRDFAAIDDLRSMRQATRLLTYPVTVTSVLHELSPYSLRSDGRMTPEGLRSFSALRYTLHPPRMGDGKDTVSSLRPKPPPVRIFILGARAESSLPREVWLQITHCFPRVSFHVIFIGPESMANREREFPLPPRTAANPFGGIVEDRLSHDMKITTYVDYFHTMHNTGIFAPYDPYFDVFVLYHPGLGHPASAHEWADTLPQLLETKCPILATGYTAWDMERDRAWVEDKMGGEVDILLEPGENRFRSLRWDINDYDPADIHCANWGLWAFRGKRYEAMNKDGDVIAT